MRSFSQHPDQLQEHGYVIDQSGEWRMRVPLFESWLRRYKDAFA
jgi:hypothetical protein